MDCSFSAFKNLGIPLPPNAPHHTVRNQVPNNPISMFSEFSWPASIKLHNILGHNPRYPKECEHHTPQHSGYQVSILIGKSLVNVLLSARTDQGISGLWIATADLCHLKVKQLSFHLREPMMAI
nr:uncharacterized protein LOC112004634 [Quercus suber]